MTKGRLSTLKGQALHDFVNDTTDARMSVIVEAKRSPVASWMVATTKRLDLVSALNSHAPRKTAGTTTSMTRMEAVERELRRIGLDGSARRLEMSGAFVLEVNPAQLRQLAEASSVQAIRRNSVNRRQCSACQQSAHSL